MASDFEISLPICLCKSVTDDDIFLHQDDLYFIASEAETNSSISDHPNLYSDPVTLDHTGNRDAVDQQKNDSNLTRNYKNASESIAESPRYDTHSSKEHVKTPSIYTRINNDSTTRNDYTSNLRRDPNLRHETDSTASKEVSIPTDQNDGTIQDETSSHGSE